jgi:hypothetical protein
VRGAAGGAEDFGETVNSGSGGAGDGGEGSSGGGGGGGGGGGTNEGVAARQYNAEDYSELQVFCQPSTLTMTSRCLRPRPQSCFHYFGRFWKHTVSTVF